MPSSTSLQDISSHTHKFNWNKDQPLTNLSESLLTSQTNTNNRHKVFSQSHERIFEHPEVTIKPATNNDRTSRRSLVTSKIMSNHESNGGSVPNILEHPDMRTPIVMENQQVSLSSSSSSSTSSSSHHSNKKMMRQQSADVYSTLTRTGSPSNRDNHQTNLVTNPTQRNSSGSIIDNIIESPEQEKSENSDSFSPRPPVTTTKAPVKIIRDYSETSSTSDVDRTGKHSNKINKPQSEEDDFW
ncbi:hypothetical protein I4U23_000736 [Adineta vaga]|nr:hypothetical protein I4U23_000736 [Adineta vaga]